MIMGELLPVCTLFLTMSRQVYKSITRTTAAQPTLISLLVHIGPKTIRPVHGRVP